MRTAGIVLAGGSSMRMGRAKASLDWHGVPLLAHVVRVVEDAVDGPVVVVASGPGQALPALPDAIRVVYDAAPRRGPLEGLRTGLATLADEADAAVVVATDAALLQTAVIRRLLAGLRPGDDAVIPVAHAHRHPLTAVYRPSLARVIEALLGEGAPGPGALVGACAARLVDERWLLADPAVAATDPHLDSLRAINTPAEYEAALRG
jgi:molybdenum cofactor guanylyltransferase